MTNSTHLAQADSAAPAPPRPRLPERDTPALVNRPLRAGTNESDLSRFSDDVWDLSPAVLQEHMPTQRINFTRVPLPFRQTLKHVVWALLNDDLRTVRSAHGGQQPAVRTVMHTFSNARTFCDWLVEHGRTRMHEVTETDLDQYAETVRNRTITVSHRQGLLAAVLWLWTLRDRLPPADRLPQNPPWGGDKLRDVLGTSAREYENRTERIHPDTMTALLAWSLRFVEDFADDIIAAYHEHRTLESRSPTNRPRRGTTAPGEVAERLRDVLEDLRRAGRGLPGIRQPDGTVTVNRYHLGLMVGGQVMAGSKPCQDVIAASRLPVEDATYLLAPVTGTIDGSPWRNRRFVRDEVTTLARCLSAACFVVISYFSGQRPGETLNLTRGCVEPDPATGLVLLHGRHFKNVRNPDGTPAPAGHQRPDPWVVVQPAAAAVDVLERLHDSPFLFPRTLDARPSRNRTSQARQPDFVTRDVEALCAWVADYCRERQRDDPIPPDPVAPRITASRFRRTLAWFIARRPRGLVAAAIQYGHVSTRMTLGYAGTYASGFPDELAFETFLTTVDDLNQAHQRLEDDEHVSGPAATTYRSRVTAAQRFNGRVLRHTRDAAALLADPDLQVHTGDAMTCVFDPRKALCLNDATSTEPDLIQCRPTCTSIARTDTDIAVLHSRAEQLQQRIDDPLAPPIRAERDRHTLSAIQQITADHDKGRP